MALGGGFYTSQNKILPGSYINFVTVKKAQANISGRGVIAVALGLDWGPENEMITLTADDFMKSSLNVLGYGYSHESLKPIREIFCNAEKLYLYRLNSDGKRASNAFATARHPGTRGNALKTIIRKNVDQSTKFDVITMLDDLVVDVQTVATTAELSDTPFVVWTKAPLEETAGMPLTKGENGTVLGEAHSAFLTKLGGYTFNALCCSSPDKTTKKFYAAYTERMRDSVGMKFQTILHDEAADYEGVVNCKNVVTGADPHSIVFWVAGLLGSIPVNKSALNVKYNGEYDISCDYAQAELETAIAAGKFTLHKVNDDVRVLCDINSLVTTSSEKGEDFKSNQVIRVIDQIATDIAVLFNTKYLGVIPNDESGRVGLWADIVKHHEALASIRAIEGFSSDDVKVDRGEQKNSVVVTDSVHVTGAMAKLYMAIVVG